MKKLLSSGLLIVCSITLVACGGSNKSSKSESTSNSQKKSERAYFKNNTLKIDVATLTIISTEVLPANENLLREKPQLAITYEVTNDSNEPISAATVWIACMGLSQEDARTTNKLTIGMTPQDEKFTEFTEHKLEDIKPGDTMKALISYDLDDTKTPVLLKVNQGMAGKVLGEKTISLN